MYAFTMSACVAVHSVRRTRDQERSERRSTRPSPEAPLPACSAHPTVPYLVLDTQACRTCSPAFLLSIPVRKSRYQIPTSIAIHMFPILTTPYHEQTRTVQRPGGPKHQIHLSAHHHGSISVLPQLSSTQARLHPRLHVSAPWLRVRCMFPPRRLRQLDAYLQTTVQSSL